MHFFLIQQTMPVIGVHNLMLSERLNSINYFTIAVASSESTNVSRTIPVLVVRKLTNPPPPGPNA